MLYKSRSTNPKPWEKKGGGIYIYIYIWQQGLRQVTPWHISELY